MKGLLVALLLLVAASAMAPVSRIQLHRRDPHSPARVLRGSLSRRALEHRYTALVSGQVPLYDFSDAQYYGAVR